MKIVEVRGLSDIELKERLAIEKKELNQLVLNHSLAQIESPAQIREKRKTIARILTEIRQRELNK